MYKSNIIFCFFWETIFVLGNTKEKALLSEYNPLVCGKNNEGHCDDKNGGAWTYRRKNGTCRHTEKNVPRARDLVIALPKLFPKVRSVIDFGGGPGAYLTGFRDAGLKDLVTVEPHPLKNCLFHGVQQLEIDIFTKNVNKTYDLVMSIEVAEHIPSHLHIKVIDWLISHSNYWIIFTAAHPGQPGEGHTSNKNPLIWRKDFESRGAVYDKHATNIVKKSTKAGIIHTNLHVFRKIK